jgi:hypothetical protein
LTDKNGRSILFVAPKTEISDVYAMKAKVGFDYHSYVIPPAQRGDTKAKRPEVPAAVHLKLHGTKPLKIKVEDDAGSPVAGISVSPWLLMKQGEPDNINLGAIVERVSNTSDKDGVASFDWLPGWDTRQAQTFFAKTEEYDGTRLDYFPAKGKPPVMKLQRLVEVSGIVTKADGSPAGGIGVVFIGASYSPSRFSGNATTDKNGRYKLRLSPTNIYLGIVRHPGLTAVPVSGLTVELAKPRHDLNFT